MADSGSIIGLFTVFYIFFAVCFVAPPTEFVSAGLTIQNVMSSFLGSENLNFVYYHIRRTTVTAVVHSLLPLVYYISLGLFSPELGLFAPWNLSHYWHVFLGLSILLPCCVSILAWMWSWKKWDNHPIARKLSHLGSSDQESWRAVASSIDIEFRRIDKFTSGIPGRRVIVTDSWVMKTSTYHVYIAHQSDIHLSLAGTEEHSTSYENMTAVQYLNITIDSINPKIKPFIIRLNSLEYGELKEKLQAPVRNARNIVIRQSLSELFLESFREQVNQNEAFRLPPTMQVDTCIGCMLIESDVKLHKRCDIPSEGDCQECFCRPMWCLECMGKWFASRQNRQQPETWMGSKSPCPTCRAQFCVLDVCKIIR